ncbi:MAG: hypothetical protein UU08_C0013G0011 [Candidatus Uhrbacteria bacterium GW2011_GWE2_40_58]|nr:MAG: hypothetical protein UT94_C0018G0019 [Candidatus Uhrbacteria bacterium GW2011_GWF2_40_263]KKR67611.1 MAG: hypothetical protein UU08_C0013G0011 [Candidatus Uhrbacteria bacterium GW2011_GWE2_40_58]OGL93785.1 MAG: hypothetical protein A2239_03170 [Candidatus Uhrbacteria bacterium RIFOXYA2_FULL_40_9]OGL98527.1 MAG: hypothetical protein A2332_03525 [Candidatus Uhrbacteria bacterium RIFOXYB2_FULL_41_18]HBK34944.1 hypothetical protein [Candidatus Uhrbacteria bacterium]
MPALFEDQHIALPRVCRHIPLTDDWRETIESLGHPMSLVHFCLKNEEKDTKICERFYQEVLDESLAQLPKETPEAQRLIFEIVLLQMVSTQIYTLEQTKHKNKNRHIAYLGASIQHRLIRVLLHFSPDDHFRLFEEVPTWNQEIAKNMYGWRTDIVGAASVVRVIKAILLTKRSCTLWLPTLFEDVFAGIDLCVELPFGGMYINVKSSNTSLETFDRTWYKINGHENPLRSMSYTAALTNARYDQLWFPIKILVGRSKEAPYDTRIMQRHVQIMHQTISEAMDFFTTRMRPTFLDPQETLSEIL